MSHAVGAEAREGIGRDGWSLVWALSAAQLVSWGALYYSFSLFLLPMEEALGWSRTQINGALSLGLLVAGLASLPVGLAIDRGRARAVMLGGSILGAALLFVWAAMEHWLVFYALWALMGLALAATLYEPAFAVIAGRLGAQYRKGITALTLVGGFASTVFMPLTQGLIDALGWRAALAVLGLVVLVVCGGVHFAVLGAPRPRSGGDGAGAGAAAILPRPGRLRAAARQPAFWGVAVAFTGYNLAFAALTFHLVPLLLERGFSMPVILGAIALIGPMQVVGRIAMMLGGERMAPSAVGRFVFAGLVVALLVLIALPSGIVALYAFAALYGAANGVATLVRATIVPELFSREGYATITGALNMPAMLAKALAPFAAAAIWQVWGGYDAVLAALLAVALVSFAAYLAATMSARAAPASERHR